MKNDLAKLTQEEIFAQYKMYWMVLDELCNNGQGESDKAKEIRDAAARAAKEAADKAKEIAAKAAQGSKTIALAGGRNLLLLIIKNNLDGFATKLQSSNTTNLLNKWYALGGDRTILGNAIKTGASKPAKKFGFLAKLKKIIGNTNISGIGAVPEIIATKIIAACSAAGTSIGGAPQGTAAGATLGKVVVELLPTLLEAIRKVPATEEAAADLPLTPPTDTKEEFSNAKESAEEIDLITRPDGTKYPQPKETTKKVQNYVIGGALLLAAGLYVATKKK
jgi:hypothetical protein